MRLEANSLGLPVEDYTTNEVDEFYSGKKLTEDFDSSKIYAINKHGGLNKSDVSFVKYLIPNENFVLRNGQILF